MSYCAYDGPPNEPMQLTALRAAVDGQETSDQIMEPLPSTGARRVWVSRISGPDEFRCPAAGEYALLLVVGDHGLTTDERIRLSEQFVRSGCRYAVCFGPTSSSWDDSIDMVGVMDQVDGRPYQFVMTTWHDREPLDETVDFFAEHTHFDDWSTTEYVVVVLGGTEADERVVREAISRRF